MCLYPSFVFNPKYKKNKKNGGVIPVIPDERVLWVPVGCQNCIECRKQKARNWIVRLLEEYRQDHKGTVVLFTFSNESYTRLEREINGEIVNVWADGQQVPRYRRKRNKTQGYELDNRICKLAVKRWADRWRKGPGAGQMPKRWLITELGHEGTENIHMHGFVWSEDIRAIQETWQYGHVFFGYSFNEDAIKYFMKYITKVDLQHKHYKAIVLTSPGMGGAYLERPDAIRNEFRDEDTNELYLTRTGHEMALPMYFRNKLYNDDQKEILWLNRLEKQERFILGSRIDISKGYDEYDEVLRHAQLLNREMGYFGKLEDDWKQREYELQRRKLLQKKRGADFNDDD